ncbi:PREDICTED: B3 domain-containing protein Os01g0905400-like [Ipomoea nil]|uniref:B3 domain-containing protein Os01g0905400-like n=1 Tax=Ipomoea nil TaxID=35883 RepID=UPI000901CE96|nr:PREDICTED: B3 domain-containing protein Os01g0905400-like [Ipomoea nil]
MGASEKCGQFCPLIHHQCSLNPVVSFFKVIVSNEFLETLFLPPTSVKYVSHLVGQEIYLEDSIGVKSKATVSYCKGTLAINQGWRQFSLDHNVETGDFVLLYLMNGPVGHFVVHIYGRSGCLKTNFDAPSERSNKRARTIRSLPEQDEAAGINSMNKEGSPTSFATMPGFGNNHHQPPTITHTPIIDVDSGRKQSSPPVMHFEEPFYMSGQDIGYNQEENRMHLFDLSSFEMPAFRHAEGNNNFSKGKNDPLDLVQQDVQSEKDTTSLNDLVFTTKREAYHSPGRILMDSNGISHFDEKMKPEEKDLMQVRTQGVTQPRSEMPASRPAERKRILIGDKEAIEHAESEVIVLKEKSFRESIMSCKNKKSPCTGSAQMARAQRGAKESITPCKKKKSPGIGNVQMARAECGGASDVAKETRVVKREPVEVGNEDTGNERNLRSKSYINVKSEPVDSADTPILAAPSNDSFLVMVDHQDFLELPDSWPSIRTRENKIIFLEDPTNRVWPTLYQKKQQLRVLAGGWKDFSVANELKPGQECVFQAKGFPYYSVDIRRK